MAKAVDCPLGRAAFFLPFFKCAVFPFVLEVVYIFSPAQQGSVVQLRAVQKCKKHSV